jgi:hypothetical protein
MELGMAYITYYNQGNSVGLISPFGNLPLLFWLEQDFFSPLFCGESLTRHRIMEVPESTDQIERC